MDKKDIMSMLPDEIAEEMAGLGQKRFVAGQIFDWIHKKRIKNFDEMSNLSKALRTELEEKYYITNNQVLKVYLSEIDGTRKYLIKLSTFRHKHKNS